MLADPFRLFFVVYPPPQKKTYTTGGGLRRRAAPRRGQRDGQAARRLRLRHAGAKRLKYIDMYITSFT